MNRLNIITLGVKDMKRSLQFYKGLGFETEVQEEDKLSIVFFKNEGTRLAIYPLEALAIDISLEDPPKKTKGFTGITIAYNVKEKEEVDATIDLAVSLGGTLLKKPEQVFWGGYSGYFSDPDGYVFEVAYSESFEFDANNMIK